MDFITITIDGIDYYMLKEVCKKMKIKTQKLFEEIYGKALTFKDRIGGKFISVQRYNEINNINETQESTQEVDINNETMQKKFIRTLYKLFHPDNNGDNLMFMLTKQLDEKWKQEKILFNQMIELKRWNERKAQWRYNLNHGKSMKDFEDFMKTYEGEDKDKLYREFHYRPDGTRIF